MEFGLQICHARCCLIATAPPSLTPCRPAGCNLLPAIIWHCPHTVSAPEMMQVKLLREKFKMALGDEMAKMVDINTIDGFQVHRCQ